MKAFALEQLEIVERQLATIENDYGSESSRREARALLEKLRNQNEHMLELLAT
jgi:hypothetical protein